MMSAPRIAAVSVPARRRWRAEARAVFALAWPIVLGNLTHMAIFATDTAFIGHYAPHALAAAALATNLMHMLMSLGFGLAMAAAPMIANALGRGRHAVREVRRSVRQALWVVWAYSALAVCVLWQGEAIFRLFGQDDALSAEAAGYLGVIKWMIFPLLGFWVLRFFILTLNRPRITLVVTAGGIVVNAAANYALVFGHFGAPEMGLVGSGIASALASAFLFGGLAAACLWDRQFRRYAVFGRFWRADWPRFRELWRLGLPIGVTSAMEGLMFGGGAFVVGHFGAESLAAHAVVMQLSAFAFMIPLGLSEAATIRVGLWAGRGDDEGVTVAGDAALTLAAMCAVVTASAMVFAPGLLIAPFLEAEAPGSAAVADLAARFLLFAALFQVADCVQMVGAGALRGLKDTRMHMAFILVGHLLLATPVGIGLAFAGGFGGLGVWVGFTAGLFCVAALVLVRWRARHRLGLLGRCMRMTEAAA
ncbi:MAG: MATE family efflux transporter [Rhodospirillaceae bacterium]